MPGILTGYVRFLQSRTGLAAGGLDRPYPMLLSSTVVRTPIPRTSLIAIGSAQPFQDWEWSLVLKVGVTVWFVR